MADAVVTNTQAQVEGKQLAVVPYTSAYASPPVSPVSGDMWVPSDGFYALRYSGSAWAPWGPIFPMTPPNNASFAWVNQGGASVSTANGGIYMHTGTPGTGDNLRVRKMAAPSTPYTLTAAIMLLMPQVDYMFAGVGFRESSSGKITTLTIGSSSIYSTSGPHVSAQKWTDETTFSASYTLTGALFKADSFAGDLLWVRIADNGTNRLLSLSKDGQNFVQIHSVSRTDFLTADEICFWANANNADYGLGMTLLSWKVT